MSILQSDPVAISLTTAGGQQPAVPGLATENITANSLDLVRTDLPVQDGANADYFMVLADDGIPVWWQHHTEPQEGESLWNGQTDPEIVTEVGGRLGASAFKYRTKWPTYRMESYFGDPTAGSYTGVDQWHYGTDFALSYSHYAPDLPLVPAGETGYVYGIHGQFHDRSEYWDGVPEVKIAPLFATRYPYDVGATEPDFVSGIRWQTAAQNMDGNYSADGIDTPVSTTFPVLDGRPSVLGRWVDHVLEFRFDPTPGQVHGGGYWRHFADGKLVHSYSGPTANNDSNAPYFQWGIYNGWKYPDREPNDTSASWCDRYCYFDAAIAARNGNASFANVAPAGAILTTEFEHKVNDVWTALGDSPPSVARMPVTGLASGTHEFRYRDIHVVAGVPTPQTYSNTLTVVL